MLNPYALRSLSNCILTSKRNRSAHPVRPCLVPAVLVLALLSLVPPVAAAQETPYFVTYSHHLEEVGDLDVEFTPVFGTQRGGNNFLAGALEFEYGVKPWWTTSFYLDAQSTFGDSTIFTGWRWENRFRPLKSEHWINPALYLEYENVSDADKTLMEVVGFDSEADHAPHNGLLRQTVDHELETRLILSSDFRGWNLSENFVAEKNFEDGEPWEFGYAVGVSRPLALSSSARRCVACRQGFVAGLEFYGGAGTSQQLTFSGTSHYAAAILAWRLPKEFTLRISPGFGLNANSHRFLLRMGISYELDEIGQAISNWFR